jgi:hypothetical protein
MLRKYVTFPLYYAPDGDSAGGGAATGGSGGGAGSGSGAPASGSSGGSGAGAAAGGPGAGSAAASGFSYAEDRSKWIPPHRLKEIEDRANARVRDLQGRHQSLEQRVRALMGVAEPADPKVAEVKKAFRELMPELGMVLDNPDKFKKLLDWLDKGGPDSMGSFEGASWRRHAQGMVTSALSEFAKATGTTVEKLPQGALGRMAAQLQSFIAMDRTGQRNERYEAGDPSLVTEFVKDLVGFYVDPYRQQRTTAVAETVQRGRRLPAATRQAAAPGPGAAEGAKGRFASPKERFKAMREAFITQSGGL